MTDDTAPPLIVHVIDRLSVGGMENGIVNIINHMPTGRYRHAIICLRYATDFRDRITDKEVEVFSLNKKKGNNPYYYFSLWRLLRRLRPAIVHTRNLPTIDLVPVIALAGVRLIIHGEHGRDVLEFQGENRKYNVIRKLMSVGVAHYVAVSRDIQTWLVATVGIPRHKITQIYNGVDTGKFYGSPGVKGLLPPEAAAAPDSFVIGTVGRMEAVKDQTTLVRAFINLCGMQQDVKLWPFLVLVGDGSLRATAARLLQEAGLGKRAWLAGNRDDVPALLQAMDIFVLPSINEGISNTIIEAMAIGRPVLATRVGGNPELVIEGETGCLVPPQNPDAMAKALLDYVRDPTLCATQGRAGQERVSKNFNLQAMIEGYLQVYDSMLLGSGAG
jgi:sugar transferase (PEP-CTERM/EpsH1 system associated)